MNSSIIIGKTYHKRFLPKIHEFEYSLFTFLIDLSEVPLIKSKLKLIGINKFNIFSLRDKDHFSSGNLSIKQSVKELVLAKHPGFEISKISMIGNLRILGHLFNPVTYFVVENKDKERVVVSEVMNTYYEIKNFVSQIYRTDENVCDVFDKSFYISPFSSSKGEMSYLIKPISKSIYFQVNNFENKKLTVIATLEGERIELTDRNLLLVFFKFPLMTIKTIAAIHWQALKLYVKKIKYYSKDEEINLQKGMIKWKK